MARASVRVGWAAAGAPVDLGLDLVGVSLVNVVTLEAVVAISRHLVVLQPAVSHVVLPLVISPHLARISGRQAAAKLAEGASHAAALAQRPAPHTT